MLLALFPTISSCTKLFMYMKNFAREWLVVASSPSKKKKRYFDAM
jgi:hypothetical protein